MVGRYTSKRQDQKNSSGNLTLTETLICNMMQLLRHSAGLMRGRATGVKGGGTYYCCVRNRVINGWGHGKGRMGI